MEHFDLLEGRVTKVMLSALSSGLWKTELDLSIYKDLSDDEWIEIFNLSVLHTIEGVVGDVILDLPKELLPPQNIYLKWYLRVENIKEVNKKMDVAISEQLSKYESFKIYPILQKGHGIAYYYPNPLLRVSGDIDLYFNNSRDFEIAKSIAISEESNINGSLISSLSSYANGFKIDYHNELIQMWNPFVKRYLKNLENQELSRPKKTLQI